MNLTAQVFGLIAAISIIISMQMKYKKHILLFLIIGEALFCIVFLLLNAYTGAIICLISTVQVCVVRYLYREKKKVPNMLIFCFIVLSIIGGVVTYREVFDIFPIICSIMYVLMISRLKTKHIRLFSLIGSLLWIIYDLVVGAYTGCLSDLTDALSSIVGMLRHNIKRK